MTAFSHQHIAATHKPVQYVLLIATANAVADRFAANDPQTFLGMTANVPQPATHREARLPIAELRETAISSH